MDSVSRIFLSLIFISFSLSPLKLLSQAFQYPAFIALNQSTGFLIDSTEAANLSLFQSINRNNLSFLIIQLVEQDKYKIIAFYKNDDKVIYSYTSDTIRKEWDKIQIIGNDSLQVSDFDSARNYFNDINSWMIFDDSFHLKNYSPPVENKNVFITLGLGTSIVTASKMATIAGIYFNGNFLLKKWLLSGFYMIGESDLLSAGGDKYKTTLKLKEGGVMLGKTLTNNKVMVSANAGISRVRMRTATHFGTGWTGPDIPDSVSTTIKYGMPVAIDFSWPATSGFGFNMKIHTTLFATKSPMIGIHLGMKFGRTKN